MPKNYNDTGVTWNVTPEQQIAFNRQLWEMEHPLTPPLPVVPTAAVEPTYIGQQLPEVTVVAPTPQIIPQENDFREQVAQLMYDTIMANQQPYSSSFQMSSPGDVTLIDDFQSGPLNESKKLANLILNKQDPQRIEQQARKIKRYDEGGEFEPNRRRVTEAEGVIPAWKYPLLIGSPINFGLGMTSILPNLIAKYKRWSDTKDMDETLKAVYDWAPTKVEHKEFRDRILADPEAFKNYYGKYRTLLANKDFESLYNTGKTFYDKQAIAALPTAYGIGNEILQGLNSTDLTKAQKVALLANSYVESKGWNTTTQGKKGPAQGYFQMEQPARDAYYKYLKDNNLVNTPYNEAVYVANLIQSGKLQTGWDGASEKIRNIVNGYSSADEAKSSQGRSLFEHRGYTTEQAYEDWKSDDPIRATKAFEGLYEKAGKPHMDRREALAKYLEHDENLKWE